MSVSGAGCRTKGHNFEREVAILLRTVFPDARRGLQYQDGTGVPDVEGTLFHIECKCGKRTNIRAAMKQAIEDELTYRKTGRYRAPVVVTKDDRTDPLVTMRLEDWLTLMKEVLG